MDPLQVLKFCPNCGKSNWNYQTSRLKICQDCGYEFYKNPTIGSAGFVFDEKGIKVAVKEFLFDLPDDYEYKGIDLYPLDFYFKCKIIDMSQMKLDESESSEMLFISQEEINPEDFGLEANRRAVKRYFNK